MSMSHSTILADGLKKFSSAVHVPAFLASMVCATVGLGSRHAGGHFRLLGTHTSYPIGVDLEVVKRLGRSEASSRLSVTVERFRRGRDKLDHPLS